MIRVRVLETIARKLKEDGTFNLRQGQKVHDVSPAKTVELEIKLEQKKYKHKFEVELEWGNDAGDQTLTIE